MLFSSHWGKEIPSTSGRFSHWMFKLWFFSVMMLPSFLLAMLCRLDRCSYHLPSPTCGREALAWIRTREIWLMNSITWWNTWYFRKARSLYCILGGTSNVWIQACKTFWVALEVPKSWIISLRNEWLIIRWLIIHFFSSPQSIAVDSHFSIFFSPRLTPKLHFLVERNPR